MYTLCVQRPFSARHYLIGGDWGAENQPHAHPYRVEIRLAAPDLDEHGYLADLDRLERIIGRCVEYYQDRLLNELPEFDRINPSIEHFAQRWCRRFLQELGRHRFRSIEVRIWENETAWASYEESF